MSKGEAKIQQYLINKGIQHKLEHEFRGLKGDKGKLRFDFYLPSFNTCIEFDGAQHYDSVNTFDRGNIYKFEKRVSYDKRKEDFCSNKGIKLIRIKYYDIDNIDRILDKKISKKKINKRNYKKKDKSPYNQTTVISELKAMLPKIKDRGTLRRYIKDCEQFIKDINHKSLIPHVESLIKKANLKLSKIN